VLVLTVVFTGQGDRFFLETNEDAYVPPYPDLLKKCMRSAVADHLRVLHPNDQDYADHCQKAELIMWELMTMRTNSISAADPDFVGDLPSKFKPPRGHTDALAVVKPKISDGPEYDTREEETDLNKRHSYYIDEADSDISEWGSQS
jgi:hypothetical protein